MTHMDKTDIEELISGYLDRRLSKRQHTEVKRLLQHDRIFARKFMRIKKQRDLLKAMPRVQAPDNMFDDIKHFLDRKHHTEQVVKNAVAGTRQLVLRRILTSAAMFALLGLLAAVVYNILTPASPNNTTTVAKKLSNIRPALESIDAVETKELAAKDLPGAYPINATIKLRTNDVIAMNSFIEKAIYNNGLLDYTIPHRQTERSTYQLACSADSIVAFLSDLDIAWNQCRDAELTVFGKDMLAKVIIEDVTAAEVAAFYSNDPSSDHIQFAKQIADFKGIVKDMPMYGITDPALMDNQTMFGDIAVVKPVLTSGEQQDIIRQLYEENHRGGVNLMVIVTGL